MSLFSNKIYFILFFKWNKIKKFFWWSTINIIFNKMFYIYIILIER